MTLKDGLTEGRTALGTFLVELAAPSVPRILAGAGFDFVVIDMEHGIFTTESAARLIALARASGIAPLVRVAEITRSSVLSALEAGAHGIMAPMIRSGKDVDELYRLAKYPPAGQRGTCLGTAHTDYIVPDAAVYLSTTNESILLVGQIETEEAIGNLDEILSPGKLDVAFVGPLDLSVALGTPGDFESPRFREAVDAVLEKGREHGVTVGAFAADARGARRWIERGCRMIACSGDLFMLGEKSREIVETIRRRE
jgi:2-keto-3-deoxy-L-rhamnonate aldolase RhmA